jgi:hypothetical protein
MPVKDKRTPQENEAISDKVDELLSEGYEIDQATAIAFRMWRDNELDIPVQTSDEYRRTTIKKKSLIQQMKLAAKILGLDTILQNQNKKQ